VVTDFDKWVLSHLAFGSWPLECWQSYFITGSTGEMADIIQRKFRST